MCAARRVPASHVASRPSHFVHRTLPVVHRARTSPPAGRRFGTVPTTQDYSTSYYPRLFYYKVCSVGKSETTTYLRAAAAVWWVGGTGRDVAGATVSRIVTLVPEHDVTPLQPHHRPAVNMSGDCT